MDTDYERDQREQREDERQQAELDRDRWADMAPAERVLRTPREEVAAYIASAANCLRPINAVTGGTVARDVAAALRWLDKAREVVDSPNVVDGAALLRATTFEAADALEEGDYLAVMGKLDDMRELLDRQVRYPDVEIPVHTGDFEPDDGLMACKREAVRSELARRRFEIENAGVANLSDGAIDAIVHAAETGI